MKKSLTVLTHTYSITLMIRSVHIASRLFALVNSGCFNKQETWAIRLYQILFKLIAEKKCLLLSRSTPWEVTVVENRQRPPVEVEVQPYAFIGSASYTKATRYDFNNFVLKFYKVYLLPRPYLPPRPSPLPPLPSGPRRPLPAHFQLNVQIVLGSREAWKTKFPF